MTRPLPRILLAAGDLCLLLLLLTGILFRFTGLDWHQGTNLHPDEYGLTNTLTQLSLPESLGDYFNTRLSPLSPYQKYDQAGNPTDPGPDNRLRWGQWPIIIVRTAGELTGNTGYDEIRMLGRALSAFADCLSLLLLLLTGERLYNWRIGLLGAALSSLAVMQIQQSHFMTVDNFAVLFTMLALYAAVRLAKEPGALRVEAGGYRFAPRAVTWSALFGIALGMAVASRINLAPLAGIIVLAALIAIADLKLRSQRDLLQIFAIAGSYLALAAVVSLVTFRLAQPMSFRAETGDTGLFTLHFNPDWLASMEVAQKESNGIGGGPPSEQWAHRPALIFPWVNMVLWGMGLPLGLTAWLGFAWAGWRTLRGRPDWRAQLIPVVWVGGYFLFMGTRWVKSIRYFLPIYPFLCLLAAWALVELWRRGERCAARLERRPGARLARWVPAIAAAVVVAGTLIWASAFVWAVYLQEHTRLQATRWIWENIPASFHLTLSGEEGVHAEPVSAHDGLVITPELPFTETFIAGHSGHLEGLTLPHADGLSGGDGPPRLLVTVSRDPGGVDVIGRAEVAVPEYQPGHLPGSLQARFDGGEIAQGEVYYLTASLLSGRRVTVGQSVIANESWDEGLPVPLDGRYVFGPVYRGLTMEVRWYDDEHKRSMFLENLAEADYIILPSQRAIWSASRIPLTYPMTMEYYRALFDGRLGFELAATYQSPLKIGPLQISDLAGTAVWKEPPELPLFNYSWLAAEEAFSVYDHPPVWIFRKRADFDLEAARLVLEAVDLGRVVIESPREATWPSPVDG